MNSDPAKLYLLETGLTRTGGRSHTHPSWPSFTSVQNRIPAGQPRRNCACRSRGPTAMVSKSPRPTYLPSRQLSHRCRLQVDNHSERRLGGCTICAHRAQRSADQALDVRCRELCLSRPGALRRHEVPQARHQGRRRPQSAQCRVHQWLGGCAAASFRGCDRSDQGRRIQLHARAPMDGDYVLAAAGPMQSIEPGAIGQLQANAVRRPEAAGAARVRPARGSSSSPTTACSPCWPSRCFWLLGKVHAPASATGAGRSSSSPSC